MKQSSSALVGFIFFCAFQPYAQMMRIGVTLQPYYSFTKNIVREHAEVIPLIENFGDVHGYRIQPGDIKRVMTMDAIVVNGVGHDEFAFELVKAAGAVSRVKLIYANKDVALMPQSAHSDAVNAHTFVSINAAIQQVYTIAHALADADAPHAGEYRRNASLYTAGLRRMKAEYMARIQKIPVKKISCATVHGGYSYLLQEFGFQVDAVIEPSHGIEPGAAHLKKIIELIKKTGVRIIFTEMDFPVRYIATIEKETGVSVALLSHLSKGPYSVESFEQGMRMNLEALANAFEGVSKR